MKAKMLKIGAPPVAKRQCRHNVNKQMLRPGNINFDAPDA